MTLEQIKHIYMTSDFHLFHFNIIRYVGRPWKSVPEMNDAILRKMLKSTPDGSIVFNLGDVAMLRYYKMRDLKKIRKIILAMKGNRELWLLTGNHDKNMEHAIGLKRKFKSVEDCWKWVGFDKVFTEDVALCVDGKTVVFSHEPVYISNKDVFNIHGHTHEKSAACMNDSNKSQYRNVCFDWAPNKHKAIPLTRILKEEFGIEYKNTSFHDRTNEKRYRRH